MDHKSNETTIMRILLSFFTLISIFALSCQSINQDTIESSEAQISDSLRSVVLSFLKSWEPPFNPEKALSLFTQNDDFYLVIDGLEIESYKEWADGVPNFMSDDAYFFKSYKHEIKNIETVTLSPNSGVVTITYVWDNISKDDIHRRTEGAATLTCRFEDNKWKIVHYHGSHGEEKII